MRTGSAATVQGACALPVARGAAAFSRPQTSLARKAVKPAVQRRALAVSASAEKAAAAATSTEQSNLDNKGPLDIVFVSAEVAPW